MSRGGDLIREARRRAGLTQGELADRTGTTQSAVARWERGGSVPSLDTTIRVLRTMGYDLDYMLVPYDDSDNAQAARLLPLDPEARMDHAVHVVSVMRQLQREAAASRGRTSA